MKQTGRCPKCAGVDIVEDVGREEDFDAEEQFLASFRDAARKLEERRGIIGMGVLRMRVRGVVCAIAGTTQEAERVS